MEVYIEQVILDNFLIDFMILYLSKKILKDKNKLYRIILSCLFGTIAAVFYPFITMPTILFLCCKILVGILMISIAFSISSVKKFFIIFFTFLGGTFVMGGAVYGMLSFTNATFKIENNALLYQLKFPVSVVLFICFACFYIFISLLKVFYKKRHFSKFIYEVVLKNNNKSVTLSAFLDSGNTVIDPETKQPIHIISYSAFLKIFNDVSLEKLLQHNVLNTSLKNPKYIPFQSLSQSDKILTFEIETLCIKLETIKVFSNIRIGLSLKKFNLNNCDMILNSFIFN